MQPSKVLVSYLGGSGGDMLTASLNDLSVDLNRRGYVNYPSCTLREFEPIADLDQLRSLCDKSSCKYLSTHELKLLTSSDFCFLNLTVTDQPIKEWIIHRQMSLQRLRIVIDESSVWFNVVKSLCLGDNHDTAAQYWFERSRHIWLTAMAHRVQCHANTGVAVNIDSILHRDFAHHVCQQIPWTISNTLYANHVVWRAANTFQRWTRSSAIVAMTQQLKLMDWHQSIGTLTSRHQ